MALIYGLDVAPDLTAFLKTEAGGKPGLDLLVKGARCAGCLAKIEREVAAVPGVASAMRNATSTCATAASHRGDANAAVDES